MKILVRGILKLSIPFIFHVVDRNYIFNKNVRPITGPEGPGGGGG
jgi:hypothetical protein